MSLKYRRVMILAVVMVLLAPAAAAIGADQTLDVSVLPADTLAIDVQAEMGWPAVVPGATTVESEFDVYITNTYVGVGWQVTVAATNFESFTWDCDEWGCARLADAIPSVIDTSNLYMRGGYQDHWGDPGAITTHEGFLVAAGTQFLLMEGTSVAYGAFDLGNPRPTVQLSVPATADLADYWATLTYTIMAPTP